MTDYLNPAPPVHRRRRDDPYSEGSAGPLAVEPQEGDDAVYPGRELPSFLPARLRAAIDTRRGWWTPADSLAMAIIVVQLVVLFVETIGGSLYLDDLRAQAYALNEPFWSFIMGSNGTHFAPLPRILDWIQSRVFPLQHGPAVLLTLVIRLLLAVVFWRLLRRLFGPRMLTLLPLVMLVITPAMLPATLWYRQSITIVACTVCMLWALEAHLRWLTDGRCGALAEVVLATAAGLGFYEKAAGIPVVLAGATIAVFAAGRRPARATGAHRVLGPASAGVLGPALASVLASMALVGGFLLIYRSGPYDQGSGRVPSPVGILRLTWDIATRDVIPLLLGGPYHWTFSAAYAGTAHLSNTAVAIIVVIMGIAVVIAALRRSLPLARGFLFLLAWTMPSVVIVAAGRYHQMQLVLADATRLWVDLLPAFILAGSLAVLPWEIGACRSTGTAGRFGHSIQSGRSQRLGPAGLTIPVLAGGLVFAVVAVGSGISTASYLNRWWDNPTGRWLANMRVTVGAAEPYARVLATPLPEAVMPSWVGSQLPTSGELMQLIRPDLRFHDGDGPVRALNRSGQLVPLLKGPIAATAPAKLCAKVIPIGRKAYTGVRLTQPAPYVPGAQIEVGVFLSEVTPVRVQVLTLDQQRITPQTFGTDPWPAGAHLVHYPVPLGKIVTGVYVQTNATKIGCIASAQVWAPLTKDHP